MHPNPIEKKKLMRLRLIFSIVGGLLAVVCLALLVVSMIREEWMVYNVNLPAGSSISSTSDRMYYSRNRGLFYECLHDKGGKILTSDTFKDRVKNEKCFEIDLGQFAKNNNDPSYWYIISLRRSQIGLLSASIVTLFIGMILAFSSGLCSLKVTGHLFAISGASFLLCSICVIASQIIFHVLLSSELVLTPAALPTLYSHWPKTLQQISTLSYSIMYGLVWACAGIAITTSILMMCALIMVRKVEDSTRPAHSARRPDEELQPIDHIESVSEISTGKRLPRNNLANGGPVPYGGGRGEMSFGGGRGEMPYGGGRGEIPYGGGRGEMPYGGGRGEMPQSQYRAAPGGHINHSFNQGLQSNPPIYRGAPGPQGLSGHHGNVF